MTHRHTINAMDSVIESMVMSAIGTAALNHPNEPDRERLSTILGTLVPLILVWDASSPSQRLLPTVIPLLQATTPNPLLSSSSPPIAALIDRIRKTFPLETP